MRRATQTAYSMSSAIASYALLALTYVVLIFILPPNKAVLNLYDLSGLQYRVMLFGISALSLIVWFIAFLGYAKLDEYARSISKTPEGPYFRQLVKGSKWLAWSLPLSAIITLILGGIDNSKHGFHPTAIIMGNYISLLLPLIAFTMIGKASHGLVGQLKLKLTANSRSAIIFLLIAGGLSYCYLTFSKFGSSSLGSTDNPYFLPSWLVVLTVMVPYLYMWFVGLLATYEITIFSRNASGHIYRRALMMLASGLILILAASVALQYVNSAVPRTGHILLDYRVIFNSILRIVQGIGFVGLILGAARLKRMEEV